MTDTAGTAWELPPALRWEMEYGVGTPCDSFFLRCPWGKGLEQRKDWVGFTAEHGGERVFTGRIDECEVVLDGNGCTLELSGRGMAALLLDNEALGQDYQLATLEDILRDHVTPYGIEVGKKAELPRVSQFRVDTGSSEWTVLEEFMRACGGRTPGFDRQGRLELAPWEDSDVLTVDDRTPVTRLCCRDRRYGVLSEILVRDRYSGAVQPVRNETFCALGGSARRVLTMAGRANAGEMRSAGEEQLRRSGRELEELELTLPSPFFAMPGQLVRVARGGFDRNGLYRAAKSTVGADDGGYWTRLVLRPPEHM